MLQDIFVLLCFTLDRFDVSKHFYGIPGIKFIPGQSEDVVECVVELVVDGVKNFDLCMLSSLDNDWVITLGSQTSSWALIPVGDIMFSRSINRDPRYMDHKEIPWGTELEIKL